MILRTSVYSFHFNVSQQKFHQTARAAVPLLSNCLSPVPQLPLYRAPDSCAAQVIETTGKAMGSMFHFWCPVPVHVHTHTRTYREATTLARQIDRWQKPSGEKWGSRRVPVVPATMFATACTGDHVGYSLYRRPCSLQLVAPARRVPYRHSTVYQ
jgi:hypothetical protein